jgi:3,4-dihydroxy 2-butanone 4-phosphate synthase / GTP cyclohydrolase II
MRRLSPFIDVETALDEMRAGRPLVLVDDEDRENEGDLTLAAEKVTAESVNFMATHGRGLICLALSGQRTEYLRLRPMTALNTSEFGTAFTESIDAKGRGVTTGVSAFDRAQTILAAIDPATRPEDLARPGHIFPLRARDGGVLVRAGQTEASVDLARLAGLTPAAVICEIMNEDGTMARVKDLTQFCQVHDLKMLSVAELIRYRMAHERCITRVAERLIRTDWGAFRMVAYRSEIDSECHLAMVLGNIDRGSRPTLVRMHSHCVIGDVFGAHSCVCSANLRGSLERIAAEGAGAVIYLHLNAADCFGWLYPHSKEVWELDRDRRVQRDIGVGAQILRDLNLRQVRLLTNHPRPLAALDGYGIEITEHVPVNGNEFPAKEMSGEMPDLWQKLCEPGETAGSRAISQCLD